MSALTSVESNKSDVLVVQGRMTLGYGIIPKLPMQDTRLTIEAKAIYSYICSYAGAGSASFPSRDKMLADLQISKDRFYKHFDLLKKHGYIEVSKSNGRDGKFANNIYTLIEMSEPLSEPCPENKDVDKTLAIADDCPCPENKDADTKSEVPCPCFPDTGNKDTISNSIIINDKNNTCSFIHNPILSNLSSSGDNDEIDRMELCREKVKENIEYDLLDVATGQRELVDELVELIVGTICSTGPTIRVCGKETCADIVKDRFFKLRRDDIEYVMECMEKNTTDIRNIKSYLLTALFNAPVTKSHFYLAAVNHDMYGSG